MDQDKVTKFYQFTLFGNFDASSDESIIRAASRRAYRDMCRTLRFVKGTTDKAKTDVYNETVEKVILSRIKDCYSITEEDKFSKWHKDTCEEIIKIYTEKEHSFSYGQAQKWVNMTLKYLALFLDSSKLTDIYEFLHIPIDSIIIEKAKKDFDIPPPAEEKIDQNKQKEVTWSNLSFGLYDKYQKDLMSKIGDMAPLDWEFNAWLETQNKEDQQE